MKLLGLVAQNLRRNTRNFVFSAFGIIVGISTFIFFVALGEGIKTVVLEEIFVIRQLEVVPRSYDVGAFNDDEGFFDDDGYYDYEDGELVDEWRGAVA